MNKYLNKLTQLTEEKLLRAKQSGYVYTTSDKIHADMKTYPVYYGQQRHRTGTSRSHASKIVRHIVPDRLAKRVWWTKSQSSLLNIYFSLSGFQSSLLHIHFRNGSKPVHTIPNCGSEPIRYVTLHFRDQRGAASLCYRNRAEITVLKCVNRSPGPGCSKDG